MYVHIDTNCLSVCMDLYMCMTQINDVHIANHSCQVKRTAHAS